MAIDNIFRVDFFGLPINHRAQSLSDGNGGRVARINVADQGVYALVFKSPITCSGCGFCRVAVALKPVIEVPTQFCFRKEIMFQQAHTAHQCLIRLPLNMPRSKTEERPMPKIA